jgi:hypothetical protein
MFDNDYMKSYIRFGQYVTEYIIIIIIIISYCLLCRSKGLP